MSRILFITISIVCLFQLSEAQRAIGFPGTLDFHFVPLPIADRNPRWRLGMEYHTRQHVGYNLEVGFGNSQINHNQLDDGTFGLNYSFFEIHPEVKWYRKEESEWATYFSAELFYLHMKDRLANEYYYTGGDFTLPVYYEQASINKEKIGLQVKAGIKFLLFQRIMLDLHEGIGVAYRNITYTNLVNPMNLPYPPFEEWYVAPYKKEGSALIFQLALGCKVGFLIAKSKVDKTKANL